MSRRDAQAAGLFCLVYALLVYPIALWPQPLSFVVLAGNALYCLLALGLASETTELILALGWKPVPLPRAQGIPPRSKAALAMVVCDDWSGRHLSGLEPLSTAGYTVFLLDDSVVPANLTVSLTDKVFHVRRSSHAGAKAGNLNHWLRLHGQSYNYLILLDADSVLSVEAADALLLSAEHPDNDGVAVFQAKIEPAPSCASLLATFLAAGARPRARVLERVHAPLGLILSFGHNQLLRLAPLRALGGFTEILSNEDTAVSLQLVAGGWKIALVDVWTWDEDPSTVAAYSRRTLRWARQTLELFRHDWPEVPLRLKLLLCRHLLMNTLPIIGTALLALSLWTGPRQPQESLEFLSTSLRLSPGYAFYGITLWVLSGLGLLFLMMRIALARIEGVSWRVMLLSWFLGTTLFALLVLPLAGALLRSLLGERVPFVPTNSRAALAGDASLAKRLSQVLSLSIVLAILAAGAIHRPGGLLLGTNLIWCVLFLLSPLSLLLLALTASRERDCEGSKG
jgi:hypothetical protein